MEERTKILVVEDDSASAEVLTEMLAMDDYDVETVSTADQAIAAMTARRHGAVLLDLTLPGLTTSELIAELQRLPSKPPIVIFSARTAEDLRTAAERLSAAAVLQKPVAMEALLATMARVARRET
jgi:DNA-binding response OmpR family regulator